MRKTLTLTALLLAGCSSATNAPPPPPPTACFEALDTAEGIMLELLDVVDAATNNEYGRAKRVLETTGANLETYGQQKEECHDYTH